MNQGNCHIPVLNELCRQCIHITEFHLIPQPVTESDGDFPPVQVTAEIDKMHLNGPYSVSVTDGRPVAYIQHSDIPAALAGDVSFNCIYACPGDQLMVKERNDICRGEADVASYFFPETTFPLMK